MSVASKSIGKRKNLGRGLSALIPPRPTETTSVDTHQLADLQISEVLPSDGQPRQFFDDAGLDELAASIKAHGILQPIVVRRRGPRQYEIVAGERRWRASQRAGLKTIRAVISDIAEKDTLTLALVENIQRRDLNPIEEAEAYQRLNAELGYNQGEIADAVGKNRTTITNALRLLRLPQEVQELVLGGTLTMGHGRALLSLNDDAMMQRFAGDIQKRGWNVRQTEHAVAEYVGEGGKKPKKKKKAGPAESTTQRDLRLQMQRALGTKVEISQKDGKGAFKVFFGSYEELERICEKMAIA